MYLSCKVHYDISVYEGRSRKQEELLVTLTEALFYVELLLLWNEIVLSRHGHISYMFVWAAAVSRAESKLELVYARVASCLKFDNMNMQQISEAK